jgi:hypothetical protein
LFPNIQLNVARQGVFLVRIYPDRDNPGRSITRISYYHNEENIAAQSDPDRIRIDESNVYDMESRSGPAAISVRATMEIFQSTVEQEDYAMGELTQSNAESGQLEYVIFGRNEPALHHYHNSYRKMLGLPPLEILT